MMFHFLYVLTVISGLTGKIQGRIVDELKQIPINPALLDNMLSNQYYH